MELGGRLLGPVTDLIADCADLEPIRQCPQRRGVPHVPNIPEANQANTEPHGEESFQSGRKEIG